MPSDILIVEIEGKEKTLMELIELYRETANIIAGRIISDEDLCKFCGISYEEFKCFTMRYDMSLNVKTSYKLIAKEIDRCMAVARSRVGSASCDIRRFYMRWVQIRGWIKENCSKYEGNPLGVSEEYISLKKNINMLENKISKYESLLRKLDVINDQLKSQVCCGLKIEDEAI